MKEDTNDTQSNCKWFTEKPSRLRVAATWAASRAAAGLQNAVGSRHHDGFAILMYHRIADHVQGVDPPTLNVTPGQLHRQLTGLLTRGFVAWPLTKLVRACRESQTIPANVFAVTFDDGYENNYLNAWPVLRELNVPATIFVATKYLDTERPFPFDDWSATGSSRVPPAAWRPMTTRQCSELVAAGGLVELGAHTHSHERYVGHPNEFRRDMRLNLDVLRDRFDIENPTFAFPYGEFDSELIDAAKQLGVICSLTTHHRRVRAGDDEYRWGRFDVYHDDTPVILAAKITGWYTAVGMAGKTLTRPLARLRRAEVRPVGTRFADIGYDDAPRKKEVMSAP